MQLDPTIEKGYRLMTLLGLEPRTFRRFHQALDQVPYPASEIADRGLHYAGLRKLSWPDIRNPGQDYQLVRITIGVQLVSEASAECGVLDAITQPISSWLERQAPIKHLGQRLGLDLRDAPLEPWPGMRAPYPAGMLVALPKGVLNIVSATLSDPVAMLGLAFDETEAGLLVRTTAWGWAGSATQGSWEVRPDPASPISRLAWGITALLNAEPAEVEVQIEPAPRTGLIRRPADRPGPSWITPPIRLVRPSRRNEDDPRSAVRGHWRRAHQHRYRVGKGRQKLITHWRPAEWVGGDQEVA